MLRNQQLSYYYNKEVEKSLHFVLEKISLVFEKAFSLEKTAALILIGGYGRGEGGIVNENGKYYPHNNLDLVYIHNGTVDESTLRVVNNALQDISKTYGIGIDMSAINKKKLLTLNTLVMSYDMRYGHKTLLGDSTFLKEHEAFSLENIDPIDVRQLLVNRGTLLLINRILLSKKTLTKDEKKLIIKHTIKAIIGYGDALLYFKDAYHWSYAQKEKNMSELVNVSSEIKELYSKALLFRFMPDYESYLLKDLEAWNESILPILSSIQIECERINLVEDNIKWSNYFSQALKHKSYPCQNVLQKVKSFYQALKKPLMIRELNSYGEVTSYMQFGVKGMLSLIFPYIAYKVYPQQYLNTFQVFLNLNGESESEYLKRFLLLWGKYGDPNFINVLRTHNIELERL